ncbi:hypothetical protein QTP70_002336 [Hemibagrus guttatus]|uniref:Uncharacterized protein n=1 Tax=Hemibagrus guttatus TaxID=175788 RepID=A0AAE0UUW6_9TELE|nr:hypothetical protein QTP70_002336 [Hemibagrus guttatus]
MKQWCIVQFQNGGTEIVPHSWLIGKKLLWPPYPPKDTAKVRAAVKKYELPTEEWLSYEPVRHLVSRVSNKMQAPVQSASRVKTSVQPSIKILPNYPLESSDQMCSSSPYLTESSDSAALPAMYPSQEPSSKDQEDMERMEELANLMVLQDFVQNQIQFTDQMIDKVTEINSEISRLSSEKELEWSVDSDDSDTESSQDKYQQRTGERQAAKWSRRQEYMQVLQDEINNILGSKPLSMKERAELEYLHHRQRDRILKSTKAEDLERFEECMRKVISKARKRSTLRQEQKQRKGDALLTETVTRCLENRRKQKKLTKQFCLEEEEVECIENEKAEKKEKERIKKEKDLKEERQRQRGLERMRDSERWRMEVEESFEEMKRRMNKEVAKLKRELDIERESNKKMARQATKRQQCLEKRAKMLAIEIEEMKRNAPSTSNVDVKDGKAGVSKENAQEARMERKTQAERQKEVVEGQRKQQEAKECNAEYNTVRVDHGEGSWQKFKRRAMAFFAWRV